MTSIAESEISAGSASGVCGRFDSPRASASACQSSV